MKRSRFKKKTTHKKLRRSKTDRAKLIKACDVLWSKLVRERDKLCPKCWLKGDFVESRNAHHIFSRRYIGTRHDLDNGIGLCIGCHTKAHEYPEDFRDFMVIYKPVEYLEVKKLAQFGEKITKTDLEETLKSLEQHNE